MRKVLGLAAPLAGSLLFALVALPTHAEAQSSARLRLDQVFGVGAGSLSVPFGTVDAFCTTTPVAGVSCTAETATTSATWYGDIRFRVELSGLPATTTAKLTGLRQSGGSIPAGQLLDGSAGVAPTIAYSTVTPIHLATGLGNGRTFVARSIGLKVKATDPGGSWSGSVIYSLVIE